MRITVDSTRCAGHGRCYMLAPDLIQADVEGFGVATAVEVRAGLEDMARQAVGNCPEAAVELGD